MKHSSILWFLGRLVAVVAALLCARADAAPGYMAFLGTPTTVKTGDAASYMRAGADWDGTTISGGIATPNVLQISEITTTKVGSELVFVFKIPDRTTVASGSSLSCGDQVILQFGPPNSSSATLVQGQHVRFGVAIVDSTISGGIQKWLPNPAGRWSAASSPTTATTTMTSTTSGVTTTYTLTVRIPLSEIGSPATDFGLALALVNDLGHGHGTPTINEATGTAFPLGMGITPESDPGFTCGSIVVPSGETATGNWIKPSTWGLGYVSVASAPPGVALDQSPQFTLSRAIRIGNCSNLDFNAIAEVTASNWVAVQQDVSKNWYRYNPQGPCRMTIWVKPTVSGAGIIQGRFLVVWGRPGISQQDWYFATLSDPVAMTSANVPVSFLWNNVPAVSFSDHPCLRVYLLPAAVDAAGQALLESFKMTPTNSKLAQIEAHFGVVQGSSKSAQMNFANIGTGVCPDQVCRPLVVSSNPFQDDELASYSLVNLAAGRDDPAPRSPKAARIVVAAFGIDARSATRRYAYVEPLGSLGWAVADNLLGDAPLTLKFEVANPTVSERTIANGQLVDIGSPPRHIMFATTVDTVPGMPNPKIDLSDLGRLGTVAVAPGQVVPVQIKVSPGPVVGSSRYALWLALGRTSPQGSFSNTHKGGGAATLGFEYAFTPSYAVEATLGRHSFGGKNGAADIDVTQFGMNAKWSFAQQGFKPFVTAGVGGYAFDPGSTRFGANLGAGVQVDVAPQWSLEGRYTLHQVSGNAPNSRYATLQLGLRYAF